MPILSANRIGGVRKDILCPKLGASTLEWVLSLCTVIIPLNVKCFKGFPIKIVDNCLVNYDFAGVSRKAGAFLFPAHLPPIPFSWHGTP